MYTLTRDRLRLRSDVYRCLAVLCCEPAPSTWRAKELIPQLHAALETCFPAAAIHARRLQEALDETSGLDLARQHARLFIGPGRLDAPPYGSVWLDPDRRLMGPSTQRVTKHYRAAGVSLDDETHDAPDHIAVELEFLHFLDWKGIEAATDEERERCMRVRREFLDGLVAPWISEWSSSLRAASPGGFYGALAECLEFVVLEDVEEGE